MRPSEAILAGQEFAGRHHIAGGYYKFTDDLSTVADDIYGDVLFTAYLGERKGAGLLDVLRALRSSRGHQAACSTILHGLMQAWPVLGVACSTSLKEAARAEKFPAPAPAQYPRPGESLFSYLCWLNKTRTRRDIADMLDSCAL